MSRGFDIRRQFVALLVVGLVASGGYAGTAIAQDSAATPTVPIEDAFVVEFTPDGDAHVTVTTTFALVDSAEKRAYRQLQRNETKQRRTLDRFTAQLRTVAATVENRTGREMTVEAERVTFQTAENGTVGIAAITVVWTNLAAESDGVLVVEEPFASGFELPDRQFVLRPPASYSLTETEPAPDARASEGAVWKADATLQGFHVVMGATKDQTTEATASQAAGFGATAALLALLCAMGLARRR